MNSFDNVIYAYASVSSNEDNLSADRKGLFLT